MIIKFSCPKCGKEFKSKDEYAGRKFTCDKCGKEGHVPTPPLKKPTKASAQPPEDPADEWSAPLEEPGEVDSDVILAPLHVYVVFGLVISLLPLLPLFAGYSNTVVAWIALPCLIVATLVWRVAWVTAYYPDRVRERVKEGTQKRAQAEQEQAQQEQAQQWALTWLEQSKQEQAQQLPSKQEQLRGQIEADDDEGKQKRAQAEQEQAQQEQAKQWALTWLEQSKQEQAQQLPSKQEQLRGQIEADDDLGALPPLQPLPFFKLNGNWRGHPRILTTNRATIKITYGRSILSGKSEVVLPIGNISSVSVVEPGKREGAIMFKVPGGGMSYIDPIQSDYIVCFADDAAYQIALKIKEYVETFQERSASSGSPVSAADEIGKLKALMDQGVITPEDFAIKKRRLLES